MPKSSRKKKEKVADFSKAKLKLGKGKKLPSNVIDTSFKARSIALPTQSIVVEKDDAIPTNRRRQTLSDILSLLKHYSAGTRREAIFGARELFQDHPESLEHPISLLLGACARLIGDEDVGVRKALLSFFDWIFPRLQKKDLIPHVPLLLLFIASAQTHIFPEIRIDAVRFLSLLLDTVPESVVCGWNESGFGHGNHILEGYLGILSAGTKFDVAEGTVQATSTASVVLSPQSKLIVLQSLSSFLSHAIDPQTCVSGGPYRKASQATAPVPTWFLRPSFVTTRLYEEHANMFQPSFHGVDGKHLTWNTNPDFESFDEDFACDSRFLCEEPEPAWDLSNLSDLSPEKDNVSRGLGDIPLIMRLSRTLYPTLTAAFLDGAPVVFSPSTNPAEMEVQMLMAAFKITQTLYGAILQSPDLGTDLLAPCEELETLLDYLTRYFPFTPAHREVKLEQAFQDLSVIYCEMTSLRILVSRQLGTGNVHRGNRFGAPRKPSPPSRFKFSLSSQADLVKSYVIRLLRGDGGSGAQLPRPISAVMYTALLPTIWALLNQRSGQDPDKESSSVLAATLDHAMRTTSGSAVKRLTVEFVGRLLLLEKEVGYAGYFNPCVTSVERKFQEWVIHLPKTLWEVGTDSPATTQVVLGVLLRLLQRGSHVIKREQISSLSSRLTPFFMIVHPIRGQVLGPFARISATEVHVRCLVLDLCATLVTDQTRAGTLDGLCHAVSVAVKGTKEELYWGRVTDAMQGAKKISRDLDCPPEIRK